MGRWSKNHSGEETTPSYSASSENAQSSAGSDQSVSSAPSPKEDEEVDYSRMAGRQAADLGASTDELRERAKASVAPLPSANTDETK